MRPRLVVALLVLVTAFPAVAQRRRAAVPPPPWFAARVDAIATAALDHVPGLTIAVRQWNDVYAKGYGLHDREAHVAAGKDSTYQIGSITKQFTAAAIVRLEQMQKLSIDDRARKWVPELAVRYDAITLRQLLNHTAGLGDYTTALGNAYVPKSPAEIIAIINSQPPAFSPGIGWKYSNSGYYVLGLVVERASGVPYAQFLRDTFFVPLGLSGTSYCGTAGAPPDGYFYDAGAFVRVPATDMSLPFSAGALCSTANDLLNWTDALFGGRVLGHNGAELMMSPAIVAGQQVPYGFGVVLTPLGDHVRVWHDGAIAGFSSYAAWFPDRGVEVVVLANVTNLQPADAVEIGNAVAAAVLER